MKKIYAFAFCCMAMLQIQAQQLPVQVTVPSVCTDPNQQFGVLSFDVSGTGDKFTILYYQILSASVATDKEYLREPGDYVMDKPKGNYVPNSNQALLLVRQTIQKNGEANTDQVWVLAKRKMESSDEYKLQFRSSFNHPIIKSNVPVKLTVHNLDNVDGLSDKERIALTMFVKKEFAPDNYVYTGSYGRPNTAAEDIKQLAQDFKALGSLRQRGNLPREESIVIRTDILPKKKFAITKQKGETQDIFRFYLTEDNTDFSMVDSLIISGDMTAISINKVFNASAQPVGAYANFLHKYKDAAGVEQSEIMSFLLDDNDDFSHWNHQVGKNKLSSLRPEVCWMDGKKLMVLSANTEKIFKSYSQVHMFERGKEAVMTFPATEEEKKSEKFGFVKTYQTNVPMDNTLSEKFIPMAFVSFGNVLYIMGQDFAVDQTKHVDKYMSVAIYRLQDNKVTNTHKLNDYIGEHAVMVNPLVENSEKEVLMLHYLSKIQLAMDKDGITVTPIETPTNRLVPNEDGSFISGNDSGHALLSKTTMGTKYTLFYYPAK